MIKDILILQKRELESRDKEIYIPRIMKERIDNSLIKVIIGPRRSGKSFFSMHLIKKLGSYGYVNFDDERLIVVKDYDEIINSIKSIYDSPKYLLLDEIQNLERWELFVNRLQRQGYNLIITGSNSKLLSKELATHLTGRHIPIVIFPLSFKEYIGEEKISTTAEIKERLYNYLLNGGYPEPFVKNISYTEYLSTLFDSIVYKDIVKRYNIKLVNAIEDIANYLISNIAKEFSYNTLAKVTKCKSVHTVEKYLDYLEEAFILFKINKFSFKLKEQISSNKKIYCIDNGLITSKSFSLSPNLGQLYENAVAIELKKLELKRKISVYFWKGTMNEEVDFVVKGGHKVMQLIQVCYKIDEPKTKYREIRGLIKASDKIKCNNLLIITEDYEAEEDEEWFGIKRRIKYLPLWKWLLLDNPINYE